MRDLDAGPAAGRPRSGAARRHRRSSPPASAPGRAGEPGRLIGRERAIADLRLLVASRRLVTLTGPGGIGKTSLLRALAAAMAAGFPDGAVVVPLGDFGQPALVPAQVAEALEICEEPGVPVAGTLAAALADRRLLLALDGTELVAGACADLCQQLLASSPGLVVVAARREPLHVPGETTWPVPPLDLPGPGPAGASQAESGAVRLLAARSAGSTLDDDRAPEVTGLCRALGGVPLALELAAARLGPAGAGAARDAVTARLGRAALAGEAPVRPGAALEAVLGWTHDLLDPAGQVLLRRLSVFAGWSGEMAERVCGVAGLPAARVAGLLAGLAEAALVVPEPGAGPDRYRMPGAVRDYAAARLAEAGETGMMRRRLRDYIAHLADYAATIGTARVPATWPVPPEICRGFDADADNFRAVLAWSLEHDDAETGLRVCTALRLCWLVRDTRAERIWWLDALGDAGADVPATVLGPALTVRAQLAFDGGDLDRARSFGEAGLDLCRAARDTRFSAAALDVLARVAVRSGRPQDALRYSGEALELTRASDDQWTRGFPLGSRAIALAALGRLADGMQWAQAGLALMQELDNQWGVAVFRLALGNLAWSTGDLAAARAHYLAALPFAREFMSAPKTARCLAYLGRVALGQGDLGPAREYLADSLCLSLDCGSRAGIIRALRGFAELTIREGQPGRAVQLAAAMTALSQAARRPPPSAGRLQRFRDAAAGLGEDEVARLWAEGLELTSGAAAGLALESPPVTLAGTRLAG